MTDGDISDARTGEASRPGRTLLVAGTASHVGKSTVVAGLCRRLADRGVSVAPFKAQNMSNNARAVPRADAVRGPGSEDAAGGDASVFGEVGVSQFVQARAARVHPTTDHNPVLLKPRGDGESQLVVDGDAVAHFSAGDYYETHWDRARTAAEAAHGRLADRHDVVVAEGAGSIAEINLHDRDLANVETARFAGADVLLVADIERGGVFASLLGTLELMPDDARERVVGAVVTKFRGDRSILTPGLDEFEARTGVPILAVLPYDDPGLPEEDSVSLPAESERATLGGEAMRDAPSPAGDDEGVTVAVPRLPCISNATDLEPLAAEPGVRVAFVPLDSDLSSADAVVVPGTKNTADDLIACRERGFHDRLRAFDGPVVGLCGGYQLLGERLLAADAEGTGDRSDIPGIGLLPVETTFSPEKRVAAVEWSLDGSGPLSGATGPVSGYEIHAGETRATDAVETPFTDPETGDGGASLGARRGDVVGTYLHGLFENEAARAAFVGRVFDAAGRSRPAVGNGSESGDSRPDDPYDRAATLVSEIPLDALFGTDAPFAPDFEG